MGSVGELFWVHCTATQKMGPLGGGGHVVMGEKAEQSKSFLWVGWYFSLGWAAPKSGVRKCMKEGEGMSTSFIATASKTNKQTKGELTHFMRTIGFVRAKIGSYLPIT